MSRNNDIIHQSGTRKLHNLSARTSLSDSISAITLNHRSNDQGTKACIDAIPSSCELDLSKTALLLIDFQRDFFEEGGFGSLLGNDVSLLQQTISPTKKVLERARESGIFVVHTREGHHPSLFDATKLKLSRGGMIGQPGPFGRILIKGEKGHDIVPELYPLQHECVIDKPGKGAFYSTNLEFVLRNKGIEHLVVTGVTTEVCVHTTVREATDRGFNCIILSDCTASYFPHFHEATLQITTAQGGIFGSVSTSDAFLKAIA